MYYTPSSMENRNTFSFISKLTPIRRLLQSTVEKNKKKIQSQIQIRQRVSNLFPATSSILLGTYAFLSPFSLWNSLITISLLRYAYSSHLSLQYSTHTGRENERKNAENKKNKIE